MPKFTVRIFFSGYTEEKIEAKNSEEAIHAGRRNTYNNLNTEAFIDTLVECFPLCDEVEEIK